MTYYRSNGELYIGGLKSHKYNDNRCIADVGKNDTEPGLYDCKEAVRKGMGIHWDFIEVLQVPLLSKHKAKYVKVKDKEVFSQ